MDKLITDFLIIMTRLHTLELLRIREESEEAFREKVKEWANMDQVGNLRRLISQVNYEGLQVDYIYNAAEAVAALSFYRGGIKVFFTHWENTPAIEDDKPTRPEPGLPFAELPEGVEGWAKPKRSRIYHFYRFGESLCGRWSRHSPTGPISETQPASEFCCIRCRKLLQELQSE